MFPIDRTCIDKSLPVPVGTQLRGLLAYVISHGDMPYGTRLPSVRELASELGLAAMTVNQVFKQLRAQGLIEIRRGRGAFVARDPARMLAERPGAGELHRKIDDLIAEASDLGIASSQLVAMINAQFQVRRLRVGLRLVFAGIFERPTLSYVEEIRPFLAPEDVIETTTLEALRASAEERRRAREADLVLTFVHREVELRAILREARIATLRFIPSEETRRRLAGIDPRHSVAAVTRFEDYIAIMRPSVRQFAPHVSDILVTYSGAPDLAEAIAARDVVVYATGADEVARFVPDGRPCFEYRHAPDTGEIARILVPSLAALRRAKADAATVAPERRAQPRLRAAALATQD